MYISPVLYWLVKLILIIGKNIVYTHTHTHNTHTLSLSLSHTHNIHKPSESTTCKVKSNTSPGSNILSPGASIEHRGTTLLIIIVKSVSRVPANSGAVSTDTKLKENNFPVSSMSATFASRQVITVSSSLWTCDAISGNTLLMLPSSFTPLACGG